MILIRTSTAPLSEPMSCIIGTYHAMYHTKPRLL